MYKALVSFSGIITMAVGDVREISDKAIADDLVKAGYVEPINAEKKDKKKKEDK